jgi:hypothetical protein
MSSLVLIAYAIAQHPERDPARQHAAYVGELPR